MMMIMMMMGDGGGDDDCSKQQTVHLNNNCTSINNPDQNLKFFRTKMLEKKEENNMNRDYFT